MYLIRCLPEAALLPSENVFLALQPFNKHDRSFVVGVGFFFFLNKCIEEVSMRFKHCRDRLDDNNYTCKKDLPTYQPTPFPHALQAPFTLHYYTCRYNGE